MKKYIIFLFFLLFGLLIFAGCDTVDDTVDDTEKFKVEYLEYRGQALEGGYIQGLTTQIVGKGKDCEKVIAIPREGYIFIKWSDGVETPERQDVNVTANLKIVPSFGYSVNYTVEGGGYIEGNANQKIPINGKPEKVVAVAENGYVFTGWSDMSFDAERQEINVSRCIELIAYFEPVEKTFKYDYSNSAPVENGKSIILDRNNLQSVKFEVPLRQGYSFCGWYADKDYTLKVANQNGIYMLGAYGLSLETDTFYAKWKKDEEENSLTYKILLVFTDEVHATLFSDVANCNISIDYKMSAIERNICSLLPGILSSYLNDWFEGKVIFEVDTYFTTSAVLSESFDFGLNSNLQRVYYLFADDIPELNEIINDYYSILNTVGMNDYNYQLHDSSGLAEFKYGEIYIESKLIPYIINNVSLQSVFQELRDRTNDILLEEFIGTYIHEFIHTAEKYYSWGEIYEFHEHLGIYTGYIRISDMKAMKLYLLYEGIIDGQTTGIPPTYWEEIVAGLPPTYLR